MSGLRAAPRLGGVSLFRKRFTCVEPGRWPERRGVARVLVEHPDHANLAGAEQALAEAGYDVAVCGGPHRAGQRCPLVEFGRCELAEGADVIVTSSGLPNAHELIDAHERYTWGSVVVEATPAEQDELATLARDAVFVQTPLAPRALLDAVHRAASHLRIAH